MPQGRSQLWLWFCRNRSVTLIVSFALVLGLTQLWLHHAFHLPLVLTWAIAAASTVALVAFAVALVHFRRPTNDIRDRWSPRNLDRDAKTPKVSWWEHP